MSARPYVEFQDLVRHVPTNSLAFIDRVAGDSSDDDDDSYSDAAAASDDSNSTTDERGRLAPWSAEGLTVTTPRKHTDAKGRALISQYDDDDDHPDDDEPPPPPDMLNGKVPKVLPDGTAVLTLASTGAKVVRPLQELRPLDRHFEPGQIIIWSPDASQIPKEKPTQSGVIERVTKTATVRYVTSITPSTVEVPDPSTCFDVPTERLGFFCGIRAGDNVIRGSWVGFIDYFQEEVYVEFPDGAIACVPGHKKALRNVDRRTPDRNRPDPFSEGLYYPGQRVRSLPEVWKNIADWVRGGYTGKDEGVVKRVEVGDIGVEWVAKSLYAGPQDDDPHIGSDPDKAGVEVIRFSDINLLACFRNLWWTVGDRGILLDADNATSSAGPSSSADRRENNVAEPSFGAAEDDEDGEWEEEDIKESTAGPASETELPPRFLSRVRAAKKQGGRLMKAQRKARERGSKSDHSGTVSDATIASGPVDPEKVIQVVGTQVRVTVLWQDGSRSENIPALNFRLNNHPDPYDFWPGEIVFRPDDEDLPKDNATNKAEDKGVDYRRLGAVVRVNQNERTAIIKWQNEDRTAYEEEEEVSVYELKTDEYDVSVGDTVLHTPTDSSRNEKRKEWVGVILRQFMGECEVAWYGGTVSSVPTRELLYISGGDDDSYETGFSTTDAGSDGAGDVPEQEHTRSSAGRPLLESDRHQRGGLLRNTDESQVHRVFAHGKIVINDLLMASDVSVLKGVSESEEEKAIKAVAQEIAESLTSRRYKHDGELWRSQISAAEERLLATKMACNVLLRLSESSLKTYFEGDSSQQPNLDRQRFVNFVQNTIATFHKFMSAEADWLLENSVVGKVLLDVEMEEDEAHELTKEAILVVRKKEDGHTKDGSSPMDTDKSETGEAAGDRFRFVDELERFHLFPGIPRKSSYNVGFHTVMYKEWNRLRSNLPPGVQAWTCENEVNKLRAAIVGSQGTPYADVMFIFDICLGPTYPKSPPLVWFHSHGRRINPNLYEDGKVCLSILGTWDGDDVESWDPKTSNLLRILLSLQALVFVEEPYFNEAGYSKQRGTEEGILNSRMYNESAYLLSMKHILQTLKPDGAPSDCIERAIAHYRKVGSAIIARCRQLLSDGEKSTMEGTEDNEKAYASGGFRKSLQGLIPGLEKALSKLQNSE